MLCKYSGYEQRHFYLNIGLPLRAISAVASINVASNVQLRTNRTYARKGGTALYYKRSLYCYPIDIPPVTGCRLSMTGCDKIIIVSVYFPATKQLLRSNLKAILALDDADISFRHRSSAILIVKNPIPPLKRPDNTIDIDDAEIVECKADSTESQFSHASPPYDISHIHCIEKEVRHKASLEPKDDPFPFSVKVQTLVKNFKSEQAQVLDDMNNKAIKYFFLPLLSLLVVIFNACFKNCYLPPIWKEVEEFLKPPPSLLSCTPIFGRVAPMALDRLQVIQKKFCTDATDAHWPERIECEEEDREQCAARAQPAPGAGDGCTVKIHEERSADEFCVAFRLGT
ncbi:hypothetical protein EVAR_94057_1 [Eumeta japonica]|uniref:Uncharacterized protein n=1 Tax=Eumeta variegata TaxID=151549 RepID=A0A4C1V7Q1_EUMVA|nr:hypothetical protein EVAR_94057_1 [Eumeta japonica]